MPIIAVDFDGTLCTERFPEIGEPIVPMIENVKKLKAMGYRIILWTCRQGKVLDEAVEWCTKHGLEFDAVNDNIPEIKREWKANVRKVYCDLYIDDKSLHPEETDLVRVRSLCENLFRPAGSFSGE